MLSNDGTSSLVCFESTWLATSYCTPAAQASHTDLLLAYIDGEYETKHAQMLKMAYEVRTSVAQLCKASVTPLCRQKYLRLIVFPLASGVVHFGTRDTRNGALIRWRIALRNLPSI